MKGRSWIHANANRAVAASALCFARIDHILRKRRYRRQNIVEVVQFSLSPAEGERARGEGESAASRRILVGPLTLTLSPSEGERETIACICHPSHGLRSRNYSVGIHARPHPGPLPQGEGELFPAQEKVHRLVSFSGAAIGVSLSRGRGSG